MLVTISIAGPIAEFLVLGGALTEVFAESVGQWRTRNGLNQRGVVKVETAILEETAANAADGGSQFGVRGVRQPLTALLARGLVRLPEVHQPLQDGIQQIVIRNSR